MSRPLRFNIPGAIHHVTARGNAQATIFVDDEDRACILKVLRDVVCHRKCLCHSYCLMGNHYHLVLETPEGDLSAGMRQLNGVYTQRFNRRHQRVGHLFQGRFKAILVERDGYLLELCRYVVLNPVRARMADDPASYPWSSYRGTMGLVAQPDWLSTDWILRQFGPDRAGARLRYAAFVADGARAASPWTSLRGQVILGGAAFVATMQPLLKERSALEEVPRSQRFAHRPDLKALFPASFGTDKAKRNEAIRRAHSEFAYSMSDIARSVGVHYSTVSKVLKRQR